MADQQDRRTRLVTVHKDCPAWLRAAIEDASRAEGLALEQYGPTLTVLAK